MKPFFFPTLIYALKWGEKVLQKCSNYRKEGKTQQLKYTTRFRKLNYFYNWCSKSIFVPHFLVEYVELHICALYDLPVRRQRGSSRLWLLVCCGGVKLHLQKYVTSAAVWCIGGISRKKLYMYRAYARLFSHSPMKL